MCPGSSVNTPVLDARIEVGGILSPPFYSIIDSGADSCVFPSVIGAECQTCDSCVTLIVSNSLAHIDMDSITNVRQIRQV